MNYLEEIFKKQRALMDKYHTIELRSNIFEYMDHSVPVDLHTTAGQARLKHLAWCTVEEIAEALDGVGVRNKKEEVVDALHFLVELIITAGYDHNWLGSLERQWRSTELNVHSTVSKMGDAVTGFLNVFGMAMNQLKNKPWKQAHKPTDVAKFEAYLALSFYHYILIARTFGIETPEELYHLYAHKEEINKKRQESGY